MTTTPPEAPPNPSPEGPRVTRDDIRDVDRMRRAIGSDRYVAGVSGGVARHLDIDPAIVRVLFVVLSFFGGTGLLLYGALWLLLPAEDSDQAIVNLDSRSLMFAVVGVLAFSAILLVGDSWGGYGFPWPLTVAGIVVAVVLLTRDRRSHARAAPPQPYAGEAPVGAVPWTPPVRTPRPPNPRRRGPILFWFTLALIALAGGILGMVDVSGADVPGSAYPGLALGIVGLSLLVGAFFGRAGGLILLGLLVAPGLAIATVAENYEDDTVLETPLSSLAVQSRYEFGAGELTLDLTQVRDLEALDGRLITLDGGIGRLEVILPDDIDVEATAHVGGPGDVSVFGRHADGIDRQTFQLQDVRDEVATLRLEAELGVGEIVITTQSGASR